MDTLTHALTGVLAGRAIAGDGRRIVSTRAAGWAGGVAAVFPDSDFVLNAFGQLAYLELHQGVTHSLPMMPVWAWLLAIACAWTYDRRSWRRPGGRLRLTLEFLPITFAGLALHTVGDLFNIWGVLLWWPFSDARVAFNAIFVIDPLYSALVLLGIVLSSAWRPRGGAVVGLSIVAAYTLVALAADAHADRVVGGLPAARGAAVHQFAAPPSLAHRRVVLRDDDGWRYAFIDLRDDRADVRGRGWWARFNAAFGRPADASFHDALHPDDAGGFVAEAWGRPELAGFRHFASFPYVESVGEADGALCAWFADLRFVLPEMRPPFVWGACRTDGGAWSVRQRGRW